jgi:hypothetical protein
MSPRGKALLAFGVLAALTAFAQWRLGNPGAAPADAPLDEFSATRAIATLRAVSLDAPHPPGSPAHDVVRDRIAARLRALDYDVDIQRTFACSPAATCGTVENLIATIPGQPQGKKRVLVVAHYDSVPAGPGASDDGTGVATALEIARAIRREPMANPIAFLIDDGEEAALLGAEGFVADPARTRDAAFVINIEARGTSGTPFLFETTRERRWLVPIVAGALPRPVTTSVFATVYEMLPNDTDLTVFKRAGIAGINFAYLGDATQYHTPLDNFANVDAGSVQRRGDQVLAMVRAFGDAPLTPGEPANAVWFDVFATFVVWWPATWTPWILAVAFALLAAAIALGVRRREIAPAGVLVGLAAFVAAAALALAIGQAVAWVAGWRAPGALFPPNMWPRVAAAWCGGIAIALVAAALARRRASFDAVFAGVALAWDIAALALAIELPGAVYVALVPGAILSGLALLRIAARASEEVACIAALVASAVVFIPFALVLHDALGPDSVAMTAAVLALVCLSFAPMLDAPVRRLAPALIAAAAVLALIGAIVPNTSPSHPRHLSLVHATDASGSARWQVDAAPPALRALAPFEPRHVFPWIPGAAVDVAPAPAAGLPPPSVTVTRALRDGVHVTTLDIASQRQASRLRIAWRSAAALESLRINGVAPPPRTARHRSTLAPSWHRVVVWGASARIEIATRDAAPAEASVSDTSFGLPPSAAALIQARDASGAVPAHDGDLTIVEHQVKW